MENYLIQDLISKSVKEIEEKREIEIKDRLRKLGHDFDSPTNWNEFAKQRLTIVTYAFKPDWRELYLDCGTPNQILIATWWDTYQCNAVLDSIGNETKIDIVAGAPPKNSLFSHDGCMVQFP